MKPAASLSEALKILFKALPATRKRQAALTLSLMLIGAGAEMLGISAVLVFLTLLTRPERLTGTHAWHRLEAILHYSPDPFLVATIGFVGVMLVSGSIRLVLTWLTSSFSMNTGMDLTTAAFKKITSQQYSFYLNTGSDEILSRMEKINITSSVIFVGVQAIVSSFVALAIILFLLFLDFTVAITLGSILVGSYVAISVVSRSTLSRNSEILANAHVGRVKRIQEAIGGIRDILIDRSQAVFQHDFDRLGDRALRPQVFNAFIQYAPRIIIEVIGMLAITLLALALAQRPGGLIAAIPILGGLAVGAQRLLPVLQQSYYGWSMFFGNREALLQVAGVLSLPDRSPVSMMVIPKFESTIQFDAVSFSYVENRTVLRDVNLQIGKGERIGVVGTTGSGKSTMTDLLLGLLEPTEGRILVDGRAIEGDAMPGWQAQVAHVPQSIYLSDDTMARNIAFGVPVEQIDLDLVESAARSAGLHDFIGGLPEQYETRCGERGIRLSGGQRQRIGIARALYKRAAVLVLDEATSALDSVTEQAVMQSISELSSEITIIMIAHRVTSLADCDRILRVESGRVMEVPASTIGVEQIATGKRSSN